MMLIIADVLTYSPAPSRPVMTAGMAGVNVRVTYSLYSNVVSSFRVNRRILASFVNVMGWILPKSELGAGRNYIHYAEKKDTLMSIYTHLHRHLPLM